MNELREQALRSMLMGKKGGSVEREGQEMAALPENGTSTKSNGDKHIEKDEERERKRRRTDVEDGKDKEKHREEKERHREKDRHSDRDREKDREHRHREKDRHSDRDRHSDKDRHSDRDRDKDRDRDRDRDRDKERDRDRDRDRDMDRDGERDRDRHRDREVDRYGDDRHRHKSHRSRDHDRHGHRSRSPDRKHRRYSRSRSRSRSRSDSRERRRRDEEDEDKVRLVKTEDSRKEAKKEDDRKLEEERRVEEERERERAQSEKEKGEKSGLARSNRLMDAMQAISDINSRLSLTKPHPYELTPNAPMPSATTTAGQNSYALTILGSRKPFQKGEDLFPSSLLAPTPVDSPPSSSSSSFYSSQSSPPHSFLAPASPPHFAPPSSSNFHSRHSVYPPNSPPPPFANHPPTQDGPAPELDTRNKAITGGIGMMLMQKMGWVGTGLGKHEDGIVAPIVPRAQTHKKGLGAAPLTQPTPKEHVVTLTCVPCGGTLIHDKNWPEHVAGKRHKKNEKIYNDKLTRGLITPEQQQNLEDGPPVLTAPPPLHQNGEGGPAVHPLLLQSREPHYHPNMGAPPSSAPQRPSLLSLITQNLGLGPPPPSYPSSQQPGYPPPPPNFAAPPSFATPPPNFGAPHMGMGAFLPAGPGYNNPFYTGYGMGGYHV